MRSTRRQMPPGRTLIGSIQAAGQDATASLAFSVRGDKARGTAFLDARHRAGHWDIDHLVVKNDGGARMQLR
jgi:hypothetical protein